MNEQHRSSEPPDRPEPQETTTPGDPPLPAPPPPGPPPAPVRGRRTPGATVALVAAVAVVGAVVALGVTHGGDGKDLADQVTAVHREQTRYEVATIDIDDLPPPGGGERLDPPEPGAPDRHEEPVLCNIFSPAVLGDLGGQVEPSEGIPARHYHDHTSLRCRFDGVEVSTYTFAATPDGDGAAAVWDAYEIDLMSRHGLAIADGTGLDDDNCRLTLADSNLVVSMNGDGGDPRTCGDFLTRLAEDFASELGSL